MAYIIFLGFICSLHTCQVEYNIGLKIEGQICIRKSFRSNQIRKPLNTGFKSQVDL